MTPSLHSFYPSLLRESINKFTTKSTFKEAVCTTRDIESLNHSVSKDGAWCIVGCRDIYEHVWLLAKVTENKDESSFYRSLTFGREWKSRFGREQKWEAALCTLIFALYYSLSFLYICSLESCCFILTCVSLVASEAFHAGFLFIYFYFLANLSMTFSPFRLLLVFL